jgi:hypothetical protein
MSPRPAQTPLESCYTDRQSFPRLKNRTDRPLVAARAHQRARQLRDASNHWRAARRLHLALALTRRHQLGRRTPPHCRHRAHASDGVSRMLSIRSSIATAATDGVVGTARVDFLARRRRTHARQHSGGGGGRRRSIGDVSAKPNAAVTSDVTVLLRGDSGSSTTVPAAGRPGLRLA